MATAEPPTEPSFWGEKDVERRGSTYQTLGASQKRQERARGLTADELPYAIAAPECGFGFALRPVGVYQRDWAMEPPCSVCVLQLPSISTIAPKSLQDSWDWRQ